MLKVLGIDPGYGRCGWGIIGIDGNHLQLLECGVIETPAGGHFPERLVHLHEQLHKIIGRHAPEEAAVEQLFFTKNVKTGIDVGQARGVIILTCSQKKIAVFEYKPVEVKMAVTGYGAAAKPQIQRMVQILLGLQAVPKPDDVADALAVAICHANCRARRKYC
ncbi:crossover junction endodeoxyribonuclease RuvC [candidate division FCPU426 bacterium]|nr:crossover junction endodeoxyribonuclease RuvC [candidate division FCPU426 bacterium]